jgi:hypothetical protein
MCCAHGNSARRNVGKVIMISTNIRIGLVVLGAATLLSGCASKLTWAPTQPSPRPMQKRPISTVEVFNDQAPARPHVEVGTIAGEKKRSSTTDARATLTGEMHKKAATLGCDAIFVRDVSQPEIPGSKKQPPVTLQAGCLMWTADAAPPGAVPPGAVPPGAVPPGAVPPGEAAPGAVPGPGVPPATVGCANDMQCKGNRICENGQCVSAPSPTTGEPEGADAGAGKSDGKKCDMDTDCPGDEICQGHQCKSAR